MRVLSDPEYGLPRANRNTIFSFFFPSLPPPPLSPSSLLCARKTFLFSLPFFSKFFSPYPPPAPLLPPPPFTPSHPPPAPSSPTSPFPLPIPPPHNSKEISSKKYASQKIIFSFIFTFGLNNVRFKEDGLYFAHINI